MSELIGIPSDLKSCQELIISQQKMIDDLQAEQEKLRKLLQQMMDGNRSEKRILPCADQPLLPFESEEEFKAAQAEAEAEAEKIIQKYTVQRHARSKKPRNESLPSHLERVEQIVEALEEMKHCSQHGPRQIIDYDVTETLMRDPPRLWVLRKKYPKYACPTDPSCGIASPERPTSLVEGNRYDTSIAAAVIEAKWAIYLPIYRQQDLFATSGWTPSRSTLLNLIRQSQFVMEPLANFMTKLVQQDMGIGLDETSCRMLLPKDDPQVIPGNAKSMRLAEKVAEARAAGKKSLLGKMWAYAGLYEAPYNIFDFRVSRHRDGPDEFLKTSRCKVQGDCFSGNTSVVLHSDGRLEFVACWSHARRKVEAVKRKQFRAAKRRLARRRMTSV